MYYATFNNTQIIIFEQTRSIRFNSNTLALNYTQGPLMQTYIRSTMGVEIRPSHIYRE